ncbi:PAS domain-containing protein [Litoribacillus peritrichatus]|uniref:PAS domain-containing protein n=1 Tax=Litoribacillus peritrichatus TaxID=718191 RepID=A0ABP7MU64_9GAMM
MSGFEDFEALIGNANVGIHCVDKDGYVIYANQWELETLGYQRDEYVGHHVSEFEVEKGELAKLMKVLAERQEIENYPYRVQGKNCVRNIIFNSTVYKKNGSFQHTRCFGLNVEEEVFAVYKKMAGQV